jgi:hypothetical protein
MKTIKTLLLAAGLLAAPNLHAQLTQKGNIELGGDVTFSSQSESDADESLTTFSFNPYIGIFITNNFELGFRPGFSTQDYGDGSLNSINMFVAPAYNFTTMGTLTPYLELLIGYNSLDFFGENAGGLGVGFDGGLKIGIAGNSLLLLKLEYLSQNYSMEDEFGDNVDFTLNTLSFGVGFRVFLSPKGGTQ